MWICVFVRVQRACGSTQTNGISSDLRQVRSSGGAWRARNRSSDEQRGRKSWNSDGRYTLSSATTDAGDSVRYHQWTIQQWRRGWRMLLKLLLWLLQEMLHQKVLLEDMQMDDDYTALPPLVRAIPCGFVCLHASIRESKWETPPSPPIGLKPGPGLKPDPAHPDFAGLGRARPHFKLYAVCNWTDGTDDQGSCRHVGTLHTVIGTAVVHRWSSAISFTRIPSAEL